MRILLLTAGSRGDVEPFVALGRRALERGHEVCLGVTREFVYPGRAAGLDVATLEGDSADLVARQGVSAWAALRSYRTVVAPMMAAVLRSAAEAAPPSALMFSYRSVLNRQRRAPVAARAGQASTADLKALAEQEAAPEHAVIPVSTTSPATARPQPSRAMTQESSMDVRTEGRSAAAPQAVWALLSDIEAWPRWTPTVTSVTRECNEADGPPSCGGIGVGSRFSVTQPRLGRATWVVTEWEEGCSFTWVSRRPGVRATATHQVHPNDTETCIELGITWDGPGAWLVRALFGRMTQRYTDIELSSLVTTAEAESPG